MPASKPPRVPFRTAKTILRAMDTLSKATDGFRPRIVEHIEWMEVRNYSHHTLHRVQRALVSFALWCEKRGVDRPGQVTRPLLERYAHHLFHAVTIAGTPLASTGQYNQLSAIRVFFRYLARKNHVLFSPANDLELPKLGFRLPRAVLTHVEMERVLSQPDLATPAGIRDRAILETLYSTGVRRTELTTLRLPDLDLSRGTALVRSGKGNKDRTVPLGERALDWIERYLTDVRPTFVADPIEATLYLTAYGQPLSPGALSHRVTAYVKDAGLDKDGSCHIFRHTMATQMLERGADIRVIQEILGHTKLDTTKLYTRVSIAHLKEVHERTHPSAKRGPLAPQDVDGDTDDDRAESSPLDGDTTARTTPAPPRARNPSESRAPGDEEEGDKL